MSLGIPDTCRSTGPNSSLDTKVLSPKNYKSTPDSSASTLAQDLSPYFLDRINPSSSVRSTSNFETPSESPRSSTDSNSPAGRSPSFYENEDRTPFFTPVELQFQIDDVEEDNQVDPKEILNKEFENLRKIVDNGQQNTFFTTSINPFGVNREIFLVVSPPPISALLCSFIHNCSNCVEISVDLGYYAEHLDKLLLSHNFLDKNKRQSIAMNILTHLQCKVREYLDQN